MTWSRISLVCMMSVALAACTEEQQGVLQPMPPLAGLRYVNLVNDTGAVDFRIINFIGDAPNAGAAGYRTGGAPYGVPNTLLPPHWPVEAGRDVHIRVFMNGTTPEIASQVVFDTTCTFSEGANYTFYLYGSARTTNGVHALVTADGPTAPTGVAFRVINFLGTAQDLDIVARTATQPLGGATAMFAGVQPGAVTAYTDLAVSTAYKGVLTAAGTRGPFLSAHHVPPGVVGTGTSNPVAGTALAGTAISAVIVPASVAGSPAPQTGNPTSRSARTVVRSNDSVLVMTGYTTTRKNRVAAGVLDTTYVVGTPPTRVDTIIKFRRVADTALAAVGVTHGFAVGDQAVVAGANEAAYNGWHYVMQLADTTVCLPPDTIRDFRRTCSRLAKDTLRVLVGDTLFAAVDTVAGVAYSGTVPVARSYTSTVYSRYRYRVGAPLPATPATGTVTYRAYPTSGQWAPGSSNYTIPWVLFMIDRKPALTAP